jgi:hypothetical protein
VVSFVDASGVSASWKADGPVAGSTGSALGVSAAGPRTEDSAATMLGRLDEAMAIVS